jgi:hypothetical protein
MEADEAFEEASESAFNVFYLIKNFFGIFSLIEEMAKLEQYHSNLSSKYERNTIRWE